MLKSQIGILMKRQKKSVAELSEDLELSESAVSRLIKSNDLEWVSLNTILKLAVALNCDPSDLFKEIP